MKHPAPKDGLTVRAQGRSGVLALCVAVGFAGLMALGCSKGAGATGGSKGRGADGPVPVSVGTVTQADIPVVLGTFGTVMPYASVAVRPQVGGTLAEAHVKEGQYVKAGDLLFVIDTALYESALGTAQAELEKDNAQAALAQAELGRAEELLKSRIGAPADYDKAKAAAAAAQADVAADKVAIKAAELNLSYCRITSPIDGRTGALLIDCGNTVKANDQPIITINQVKPIAVVFSLPEQDLARVKEYSDLGTLDVVATLPGREDRPEHGTLAFIDNSVSSNTGTITLKGAFDNTNERLWPGQHVNVTLMLTTVRGALVAPIPAVQDSQTGKYAYVVKPDMTVEDRVVKAGEAFGEKVIIESGLALGEMVVTEGHLRLVPGAKVSVKAPLAEAEPDSGAANIDATAAATPRVEATSAGTAGPQSESARK